MQIAIFQLIWILVAAAFMGIEDSLNSMLEGNEYVKLLLTTPLAVDPGPKSAQRLQVHTASPRPRPVIPACAAAMQSREEG